MAIKRPIFRKAQVVDPLAGLTGGVAGVTQDLTGRTQPDPLNGQLNDQLSRQLSGENFDPIRAGVNEGQSRAEANSRAATAGRINSLGLTGQGLGDQLAQINDDKILSSRFDTNVNLGAQEEASRAAAVPGAQASVNAENAEQWKGLSYAAEYGSDEDFLAAYEGATGERLDPAAVSEYRDIARRTAEANLKNLETTADAGTGGSFAAYAQTRKTSLDGMTPDERMGDQGFANNAQELWESFGGEGEVSAEWASSQYDSANDPNLTNAIVANNAQIDEAVASGALSPKDGEMAKTLLADSMSGKLFIDWEESDDGTFSIKGIKDLSGSSVVSGEDGAAIPDAEWDAMSSAEQWESFKSTIPSYKLVDATSEAKIGRKWEVNKPQNYSELSEGGGANDGSGEPIGEPIIEVKRLGL